MAAFLSSAGASEIAALPSLEAVIPHSFCRALFVSRNFQKEERPWTDVLRFF
jgi:hypothetical protein